MAVFDERGPYHREEDEAEAFGRFADRLHECRSHRDLRSLRAAAQVHLTPRAAACFELLCALHEIVIEQPSRIRG